MAEPGPAERPSRFPVALLGLLLYVTYAYFMPAAAWNETSRFGLVRSLVERGRLDIDPFHHDTGDKSFRDGHHYSDKAPGASFLAAPVYAAYRGWLRLTGSPTPESVVVAGQDGAGEPEVMFNPAYRRAIYVCNLATNALAAALLGVVFLGVVSRTAGSPVVALLATGALGLGSLVFPYATMFYGHVLAGAFLFGAFALLRPWGDDEEAPSARRVAAAGALLGLAVLTELPSAVGAAVLAVYAAVRLRSLPRRLWLLVAGAVPAALLLMAYNAAAFGHPLRSGYSFVASPVFAEGMSRGLLGVGWPRPSVLVSMLFGRARGLFYTAPVLLLAFWGLARGLARTAPRRTETAVAAAIVLGFLLLSAGYYMWWGGAALGPRHFVPAIPFLCLGLPLAVRSRAAGLSSGGVVLLGLLLAISIANMLAATAVSPLTPWDGGDVLGDHVYGHLFRGQVAVLPGAANAGMLLGLRGPASVLPLLLLWALALPSLRPLLGARPTVRSSAMGRSWWPAWLLVLAVALVHGPSLKNGFVYDDRWTVLENPVLNAPPSATALLGPTLSREGVPDAGRPVLLGSLLVDRALWGWVPAGFHLQNVLWHLGVVLLMFLAARRLLGAQLPAVFAAAAFAVHPLVVEPVAAINYREDLLAAFFVLLALMLTVRARESAGQGRHLLEWGLRAAAFVAAAAACLSKENAYLLPIFSILAEFFRPAERPGWWRGLVDHALLATAALGAFAWRWWAMGAPAVVSLTAQIPERHLDRLATMPRAAAAFLLSLGQMLLPVGLSPEYPSLLPGKAGGALAAAAAALLVGLIVFSWRHRRRWPWPAFGVLGALAAYLPHLGLVPLTNLRADRYFYLPAAPLCLAIGWALAALVERANHPGESTLLGLPRPTVVVTIVMLALGVRSLAQGRIWRSDLALWTAATAASPGSPRAWFGLGDAWLRAGRTVPAHAAVQRGLALGGDAHGHELLGLVLLKQGDLAGAAFALAEALAGTELPQQQAQVLNNLGFVELRQGKTASALHRFEVSQTLVPWYDRPWINGALALMELGRLAEARSRLEAFVRRWPSNADGWEQLGRLLEKQNAPAEAAEALRRARSLRSGS